MRLVINKRLGITCTRTRVCRTSVYCAPPGEGVQTVGMVGFVPQLFCTSVGKHEADDHLASRPGRRGPRMRGGSGCRAWLDARAGARGRGPSPYIPTLADPGSSDRHDPPPGPLSRGHFFKPFFRFYAVFDTGNSPAPQAISVTSKPRTYPDSYDGLLPGGGAGAGPRRARARRSWSGPARETAGTRSTRTDKYTYFDTCRQSLADSTFVSHSVRGIRSGEGARSC